MRSLAVSVLMRSLLVVAVCLVPVGEVKPASQRPLSLEEMVDLSNTIVVGRVTDTETRWEGRLIVTVATVAVEETIKGGREAQLQITQLGGTAVHPDTGIAMSMSASTQASLKVGEDVLLFVAGTGPALRQLVGGAQGMFAVRDNPQTGVRELPVGPKQLEVVRDDRQDEITVEAMTLDAMRSRIRNRVEQTATSRGGKKQ